MAKMNPARSARLKARLKKLNELAEEFRQKGLQASVDLENNTVRVQEARKKNAPR